MMRDAVGVGALNVDLIYSVPELKIAGKKYIPGAEVFEDENQFNQIKSELDSIGRIMKKSGGGSAANTMYAMARMGFDVGILGIVGNDDHGDFILESMGKVDKTHVRRLDATGVCVSLISGEDRSLIIFPNANDFFQVSDEDINYLNDSRIVHLTSFVHDNALKEQERITKRIDADVILSFDPGEIYARKGLKAIESLLKRCDIMLLSTREVEMLTSLDPIDGSRSLLEFGPEIVVCKMGEKGSVILTDTDEIKIKPVETNVVDKTGAGDVYNAGFLAGILKDWPLEKCGNFASLVAAKSIAGYGRDRYPDERSIAIYEGGY
ncbi:MAG: carbohydrate kinase family protein [Methanomassiliicoccales archaeon]|jgi:ribokinase|nr:carbohydrate kinase family protein [Methanomassiliicoccales archaeon]